MKFLSSEPAVNPARAGMILFFTALKTPFDGKPRASGDDPTYGAKKFAIKSKPRASGDDPGSASLTTKSLE